MVHIAIFRDVLSILSFFSNHNELAIRNVAYAFLDQSIFKYFILQDIHVKAAELAQVPGRPFFSRKREFAEYRVYDAGAAESCLSAPYSDSVIVCFR